MRIAALPRAASYRLGGCARRRRDLCAPRRDLARAQGRAVSRRAAGIPARRRSRPCASRLRTGRSPSPACRARRRYPSQFMLVCAMNPCPCGWYGDPSGRCTCSQAAVDRYLSRISGPMLDRIDMIVEVSSVKFEELRSKKRGRAVLRRQISASTRPGPSRRARYAGQLHALQRLYAARAAAPVLPAGRGQHRAHEAGLRRARHDGAEL